VKWAVIHRDSAPAKFEPSVERVGGAVAVDSGELNNAEFFWLHSDYRAPVNNGAGAALGKDTVDSNRQTVAVAQSTYVATTE
jgi:hypothetical protein